MDIEASSRPDLEPATANFGEHFTLDGYGGDPARLGASCRSGPR